MRLSPTMAIADKFYQLNSHAKHFQIIDFLLEKKVLNLFAKKYILKKFLRLPSV